MGTDMTDRAPEGLRSLYEDLGPATFTVDDVVSGGRRRQRRLAVGAVGAAVVAVAAMGVGAGLVGGSSSPGILMPAGTTTPVATTPAPTYPGCAARPERCPAVVAAWSREVTRSTATVATERADAYEEGTVVIGQLVSSVPGQRDVHLSVVIAPTSTKARGAVEPGAVAWHLPGIPGPVDRLTRNGGGNLVQGFELSSSTFGKALQVTVDVANQGPVGGSFSETATDVPAPTWWTEATVADLVTRIYGTEVLRDAGAAGSATGTTTR